METPLIANPIAAALAPWAFAVSISSITGAFGIRIDEFISSIQLILLVIPHALWSKFSNFSFMCILGDLKLINPTDKDHIVEGVGGLSFTSNLLENQKRWSIRKLHW